MDERAVLECVRRYCLRLPRALPRGMDGERLGAGTGASLEFQDFREYVPGDDLRHIDWAAYARSDQLMVRLYREEIAPRVDLVVDASASMASTAAKQERVRELVGLIYELGRADRLGVTLWLAAEGVKRHARDVAERIRDYDPAGPVGLETVLRRPPVLGRNSIRIVVSDFLFAGEPRGLIRSLGRSAASVAFVQVLDRDEEDPSFGGGKRLTDVETAERLDLVVTSGAREAYRQRLETLCETYRQELRRVGGRLARVLAQDPLEEAARGPLREAGVLDVRGAEGAAP